jgi:uncharacterized membrane protein
MKYDYIATDYVNIQENLEKMRKEVTDQTEWTRFDDAIAESVGVWEQVIYQCVELRCFPTVLYFERKDPSE